MVTKEPFLITRLFMSAHWSDGERPLACILPRLSIQLRRSSSFLLISHIVRVDLVSLTFPRFSVRPWDFFFSFIASAGHVTIR